MRSWVDYWNTDTPIYVNARHKALHYRLIAEDVAALVEAPGARVLDWGCGEALEAGIVAGRCGALMLCDAAPAVRERLAARFAGHPVIRVLAPDEAAALPDGALDLIVAHSVIQYLTRDELAALLALARRLLRPGGRIVLGDVLAPDLSAGADALALLRFGLKGGFFLAALRGLVRTALSDYRRLRQTLGLARYGEAEMLAMIGAAGLAARRLRENPGHNPARMAFEGRA
jgi:SAM-dependent methyltransferase